MIFSLHSDEPTIKHIERETTRHKQAKAVFISSPYLNTKGTNEAIAQPSEREYETNRPTVQESTHSQSSSSSPFFLACNLLHFIHPEKHARCWRQKLGPRILKRH